MREYLLARVIESLVALVVEVLILYFIFLLSLRRLRHGELRTERTWKFDSCVFRFQLRADDLFFFPFDLVTM